MLSDLFSSDTEAMFVLLVLVPVALSILWVTIRTGVPPVPTRPIVRQRMAEQIPEGFNGVICDTGCGWGGLAVFMARRFPEARIIGVEMSPLPFVIAWVASKLLGRGNLEIRFGNISSLDLKQIDIIVCFLMISAMKRLERDIRAAAPDNIAVISNSFTFPGIRPSQVIPVPEHVSSDIFVYEISKDDLQPTTRV